MKVQKLRDRIALLEAENESLKAELATLKAEPKKEVKPKAPKKTKKE